MIMRMGVLRSALRLTRAERRFVAGAWLLAPVVTLSLRRLGFRRTIDSLRDWVAFGGPEASPALSVERGERLVARAFQLTAAHDSCLPRAIVQLALHRRRGDFVKLVIGVRRGGRFGDQDIDFEGHAWIEAAGGPRRDLKHSVILELPSS